LNYIHTLSRYFKDIYGWDTIEDNGSFIAYIIENEDLSICEFYVPVEDRRLGKAKKLINKAVDAGINAGCKNMFAKVELKKNGSYTINPTLSLKVILGHGFIPYGAHNDEIYVMRNITKFKQ